MSQSIFRNPYVLVPPALTLSSVGNGTLTINRLTHFTINQQYTAICTAISPFTMFNIVGSLDGVVGVAIVGTQFTDEDNKIFVTIQQGPRLFQVGDTFKFTVAQGTDVNQQNIDLYDELPQKNFGLGQTGQNKGDHNLRFSLNPAAAFREIGDILYTAVNTGPGGNAISIQYFAGTLLKPASLALQDLTFTANTAGSAGNLISIEYKAGNPGVNATVTIQDIAFEADNVGIAGNLISIRYIGGATAGSEVVSVIGNAITVQIEDGVSTADDIELAIALFPAAAALVNSTGTGTGSEIQFIQSATFLTGGVNADGMVVTVVGNAIKVLVQSGVTTAQEIKDALDESVPALTLINTTITGSGASTQTSPVSPTFLTGGSNDVGTPGNEVVQVVGNEIRVSFVNGLSTATQILSKILATPAAVALVTASLIGPGSNFQSSPVSRTFLGGGRDGGSYAFNTEELTNPGQFFEGNAPIIHTGQTNQGDELTLGETLKKGKVTLDDDVIANNPGPLVDNAQRTINNLIQNHKVFLVTEDNSKVDWQEPNLNFTSNIAFIFPETGVINRILTAGSPIVIADGQHAYVTVNRLVTSTVTVTVASTIPTGENIFRLFSRRGDDLVWYDNTLQRENIKIRIGEGGGDGTLTNGSIITPVRLDAKQDTLVNLQTYALTATNGQIVYATDEKQMFQVVDTELVAIGGADVIKLTAGENLALRDLVYISTGTGNDSGRTAGQLYKADASNDDRAEVVGFVSKAANVGGLAEIQLSGILKGFSGLTAGRMYYASSSSPGAITLTPPSANGSWVIAVGIALSATQIDINPVPSASAIYVVDGDTTFTIANNQATTDVTGLLFDGISTRGFIIDYSIYRQTDTASSALAQVGQLRGVYNTQSGAWFMSDDFSGQNAGVTFSILSSGQLRYSSTNIAGTNYVGTLKYAIRKTFGV